MARRLQADLTAIREEWCADVSGILEPFGSNMMKSLEQGEGIR